MKQFNNAAVRCLAGLKSCISMRFQVLLLLLLATAALVNAQTGRAPVETPPIGFGIDGDANANTYPATPSFSNTGDWFSNGASGSGMSLFDMSDITSPYTFNYYSDQSIHYEDAWSGEDPTILTGSTKVSDPYGVNFTWGPGQNPNKNEINNAVIHFTFGSNANGLTGNPDDLWCVFAADRQVNNGDAYIDFEFLQSRVELVEDPANPLQGWFESDGPDGTRTVGDILVTIQFTNGGNVPTPVIQKWLPNGSGGFGWVTQNLAQYAGQIYMTSNIVPVTPLWNPYGQTTYDLNQFAEGAINLTAVMGIGQDECGLLSTVFVRTKTSASPTAELKDFPGAPYQINICNDETLPVITEINDIILEGCNPDWPVELTTTWTDNCSAGGTISGVAGEVITNGCTQYRDYTFEVTDDCGNDATPVVVRVTRTWDVTPPVISDLADYTLEGCNADWPTSVTTTWADNCGSSGSTTGVAGDVTVNGCIESRVYTFNVTDACGNAAVTQTTTISRTYDVTAPVIADLADYSLEGCNPAWPTSVTTTYSDACSGNGTVEGVAGDVVTNGCYQTRVYTFNYTDNCGNPAAPQTTTITRQYDVTAPVIADLADYSLGGCNTAWPTSVTTTYSDACSGNGTVEGVAGDVVTNGCFQTRVYAFNYTDNCGNPAAPQTTTITRQYDETAPVIADLADYSLEGCNTAWPSVVTTTYSDACSGNGTVEGVAGDVVTNGCFQTRVYTFNYTDNCGNPAAPQTTTITRQYDVTAPVIADLADYSLEGCNTAWPSVVTTGWSDNCSGSGTVEGIAGDVVTDGCYQTRVYTFNYTCLLYTSPSPRD